MERSTMSKNLNEKIIQINGLDKEANQARMSKMELV